MATPLSDRNYDLLLRLLHRSYAERRAIMHTTWNTTKSLRDGCPDSSFELVFFKNISWYRTPHLALSKQLQIPIMLQKQFWFGWVDNKERQESQNKEAIADRHRFDWPAVTHSSSVNTSSDGSDGSDSSDDLQQMYRGTKNKPFIGFRQPRKAGLNKYTKKSCIGLHEITSLQMT